MASLVISVAVGVLTYGLGLLGLYLKRLVPERHMSAGSRDMIGAVIFSGSVHTYLGQPGAAAYAATKGGLVSMARSIAADLAPREIRVNVVAPGATKTPIWKRGARANATAEESAKVSDFFSSTVPLARWGEPEDVAKAVLFLASDDSSYINAVELMVDGGLTGAPFGARILRG